MANTRSRRGHLVIIGGAEDRTDESVILRRFVELAGGRNARIVVLATATQRPEAVGGEYVQTLRALRVKDAVALPCQTRGEANDDSTLGLLARATGVFFTGGDQRRIATVIGGSRADTLLHARFDDGLVIAGTSAGAAMMSSTMVLGGSELAPTTTAVQLGPGLEFVPGMVIDMHFAERGRIARLLAAVAMYPHELGVGIDEDTALVVHERHFEVIGSGAVTVIDAGSVTSLAVPEETDPDKGDVAIAMTGVLLHVLPAGYEFDLATRVPVITRATAPVIEDRSALPDLPAEPA